jgi:hypothetical protein
VTDALRAFLDADVSGFPGLPALRAADLGIDLTHEHVNSDPLGDPAEPGTWVALPSHRFTDGLRCWLEGDRVVLLEGMSPSDDDGQPATAPDLGVPDETFDTNLGAVTIEGGERVFADRGLAIRLNPANGILLGLAAFAPTTVDDYRRRLRPAPAVVRVHPSEPSPWGGAP